MPADFILYAMAFLATLHAAMRIYILGAAITLMARLRDDTSPSIYVRDTPPRTLSRHEEAIQSFTSILIIADILCAMRFHRR